MEQTADQILDEIEKLDNPVEETAEIEEEIEVEEDEGSEIEAAAEAEEGAAEDTEVEGHISYEDWVEMGRDPKMYRGEEAFKAHGETLQELKEQKEMLKTVMESMTEWKATQQKQAAKEIEEARAEAQRALDKAKDEDDVDAALAAKDRLSEIDSQNPDDTPDVPAPNPVIVDFTNEHPIIDVTSSQFDQDFFDDMSMIHNSNLDILTGGNPGKQKFLTERQIKRSMDMAYDKAKELNPDKFRSKRNSRQTQAPAAPRKRQQQEVSPIAKLQDIGRNKMNDRDKTPALDIYNMLKAKNLEQAEKFLKSVTAGM